jgi:hypothetical protein
MTVAKNKPQNHRAKVEIWENLVVVSGDNNAEAVSKALKLGASEQGDCGGTLRLYGKPAITKFLGIQDMGLIHEELRDGAEILWRLRTCYEKSARKLIKSKLRVLADLDKEVGHKGGQ